MRLHGGPSLGTDRIYLQSSVHEHPILLVGPSVMPLEGKGPASIHEAVAQQRPEGRNAVPPGDLLAFFEPPAMIGDGHLVELIALLEDLGGHFGLKLETVGAELQTTDDVPPEDLV